MEEEKKRIEEYINQLLNDFNEKYKVEVCRIKVDYWRWQMMSGGDENKSASVELDIL